MILAGIIIFALTFASTARAAAWMGARIIDLNWAAASILRVPSGYGVLVVGLYENAPADTGGLALGDTIVAIDGDAVIDAPALMRVFSARRDGDSVTLAVYRSGLPRSLSLTLTDAAVGEARDAAHIDVAMKRFATGFRDLEMGNLLSAVTNLRAAADMGHAGAQYHLGTLYERGQGVERSMAETRFLHLLAAAGGHGPAARALAENYELGLTVPKDDVLAHLWLARAAALGDDVSIDRLRTLEQRLDPELARQSAAFARTAPSAWSALPVTSAGAGRGGRIGLRISVPPKELLAEAGMTEGTGAYIVGLVPQGPAWQASLLPGVVVTHIDGHTVANLLDLIAGIASHSPGDDALLTVIDAVETRDITVKVGNRSEPVDRHDAWNGEHAAAVERLSRGDKAGAAQSFLRLAKEGHGASQFQIADMYDRGDGVRRDIRRALTWFRVAASQGRGRESNRLALFFDHGNDGHRDAVRAYHYYNLAASQGDIQAANERQRLTAELDPRRVADAQALARYALFQVASDAVTAPSIAVNRQRMGGSIAPAIAPVTEPAAVQVPLPPPLAAVAPRHAVPKTPQFDRKMVSQVQRSLLMLGYDPGPVDGQMGRRTGTAISAYQRDTGLPPNGVPSNELVARLQEAVGGAASAPPVAPRANGGTSVALPPLPSVADSDVPPPPPPSAEASLPPLPPIDEADSLLLPDLPALPE